MWSQSQRLSSVLTAHTQAQEAHGQLGVAVGQQHFIYKMGGRKGLAHGLQFADLCFK